MTGFPHATAQIRVFKIDEKSLVERADAIELGPVDEQRAGRGDADVLRDRAALVERPVEPRVHGFADEVQAGAGVLDRVWTRRVHHDRTADGDRWIRVEAGAQCGHGVGRHRDVRVHQEHEASSGGRHAGVAAGARTEILVQADAMDLGAVAFEPGQRSIAAGDVDDDDLVRRTAGPRERFERRRQRVTSVVRDDRDVDVGRKSRGAQMQAGRAVDQLGRTSSFVHAPFRAT